MDKKKLILKYERIISFLYRLLGRNSISVGKRNTFHIGNAFMKNCRIEISGKNNIVEIEPGLTRLCDCSIKICHSNSHIRIGGGSNINHCHLYIEDDGGFIDIGKHVTITGETHLAVIEGKKITVGEDCLFATDISFRVGDSHSILDVETKQRINPSEDIVIGKHVWIGHGVKILKGVIIADNCIVGTGSVVTKRINIPPPTTCILAGVPAKVVKYGVTWVAPRLPFN